MMHLRSAAATTAATVTVAVAFVLLAAASTSPVWAQAAPAAASSPEEPAILAVVDQFMTGLATNDFALMAKVRSEGAVNVIERPAPAPATGTLVTRRPFTTDGSKPNAFKEKYWDPIVHVRGSIAIVWAPYEFWRDGKTTHCGIDVFEMAKEQGTWRIGNMMWTVEPDACPSLRPTDVTRLRPAQ
jgi:hypothetical protein